MPRKDPVERRAWENEWIRRRRADLLARHACPCGAPATRIVSDPGTGKVTWSMAEARIEALLANKRLRCASCPDGERPGQSDEARAERHREANRDYKARRRAAKRAASADPPGLPPDPPRAAQERPERPATVTARVKAAAAPRATGLPATVFDDPGWRDERRRARMARRRSLGMTAELDAVDDEDEAADG